MAEGDRKKNVVRMAVLASLVLLLLVAVLKSRRDGTPLFETTAEDEADMLNMAINDHDEYVDDIGQRNVLLQGDALEFQRQQLGKGARVFDFDPMASPHRGAGNFDKITDTSAYFRMAGDVSGRRNASLKTFNPKTGLYELQEPMPERVDGLPGYDSASLGLLADLN